MSDELKIGLSVLAVLLTATVAIITLYPYESAFAIFTLCYLTTK